MSRPSILSIEKPSETQKLGSNWQHIKKAPFSFVAALLEIYSKDTHFYFLARDSEYLFDVARLVTDGTADASRIHLLNVSRGNMRDSNLKHYLRENGISDELLRSGKKILYVDTGFAGTIPRIIGENFPPHLDVLLKTQLVVSSSSEHPSLRVFLIHLNPLATEQPPATMHGSIISYEHMTRSTDRSGRFVFSGGRYHPISPMGGITSEGSVSKSRSLKYRKDLVNEWAKPTVKTEFEGERRLVKTLKSYLIDGSDRAKEAIKEKLRSRDSEIPIERFAEAVIRDLLEAVTVNEAFATKVKLQDLDLTAVEQVYNRSKKPAHQKIS